MHIKVVIQKVKTKTNEVAESFCRQTVPQFPFRVLTMAGVKGTTVKPSQALNLGNPESLTNS